MIKSRLIGKYLSLPILAVGLLLSQQGNAQQFPLSTSKIIHLTERQLGATKEDGEYLEKLVNKAKNKIKIKEDYSQAEALEILHSIDDVVKDEKLTMEAPYGNVFQLSKEKKSNCAGLSAFYMSVADRLNLPIKAIFYPISKANGSQAHMNIIWYFKSDGTHFTWEPTRGRAESRFTPSSFITDMEPYKDLGLISFNSVKEFSREEFQIWWGATRSKFYKNSFMNLERGKKIIYDLMIKQLTARISKNKEDAESYFLRGEVYMDMGKYDEAINDLTSSIKIFPSDKAFHERSIAYRLTGSG